MYTLHSYDKTALQSFAYKDYKLSIILHLHAITPLHETEKAYKRLNLPNLCEEANLKCLSIECNRFLVNLRHPQKALERVKTGRGLKRGQ